MAKQAKRSATADVSKQGATRMEKTIKASVTTENSK